LTPSLSPIAERQGKIRRAVGAEAVASVIVSPMIPLARLTATAAAVAAATAAAAAIAVKETIAEAAHRITLLQLQDHQNSAALVLPPRPSALARLSCALH
jgi:hypothetical protein